MVKEMSPVFIGEHIFFCARLQLPLFLKSPFSKGGFARVLIACDGLSAQVIISSNQEK